MTLAPPPFVLMLGGLRAGSILNAAYASLNLLRAALGGGPPWRGLAFLLAAGALGLSIGSLLLGLNSGWRLARNVQWG
jgi:hypothetical protein